MISGDFEDVRLRIGHGSIKWDVPGQANPRDLSSDPRLALADRRLILPLSLADMEFPPPEPVVAALRECVDRRDYGYHRPTARFQQAVCGWFGRHHRWAVDAEWIVPAFGSVPALNLAIQSLTEPGDGVVVQTPVFRPIIDAVTLNDRRLLPNPLREDGPGRYSMDLDGLRAMLRQQTAKLLVLCSPHNPVGRVWTREELQALVAVCREFGLLLVADEVHGDLCRQHREFITIGRAAPDVTDVLIHLHGPAKTFNLAALKVSTVIVPNPALRQTVLGAFLRLNEAFGFGVMGATALCSAYTECDEWWHQLRWRLDRNAERLAGWLERFGERTGQAIHLAPPEGTYLAWLKMVGVSATGPGTAARLRQSGGLLVDEGEKYGPGGEGWVRLNFACPAVMLEAALARLQYALGDESRD